MLIQYTTKNIRINIFKDFWYLMYDKFINNLEKRLIKKIILKIYYKTSATVFDFYNKFKQFNIINGFYLICKSINSFYQTKLNTIFLTKLVFFNYKLLKIFFIQYIFNCLFKYKIV